MRIISMEQYPELSPEREFKESWVGKLFTLVVAVNLLALMIVGFIRGWVNHFGIFFIICGAIFALMALLAAMSLKHSRNPANWLVRASGRKIWIKYRTYRNSHLSEDEPQIIELDQKEIAWARHTTLHQIGPEASDNGKHNKWIHYLELSLPHADMAEISRALKIEENLKTKTFVIKRLDYPVIVTPGRTLRLRWRDAFRQVSPNLQAVLEFISQFAEVKTPEKEKVDYTPQALAKLPEDEQHLRLAELARLDPGPKVIMVTRQVRKCSTEQAMEYVEGL